MDGKEGEWCMKIDCTKVIVCVVERVWHHKYTRVFLRLVVVYRFILQDDGDGLIALDEDCIRRALPS